MGIEDALPNSPSSRTHRGPAEADRDMEDGEVEEESKGRRHHHHHHHRHERNHSHRHHRRSHVKQGKEEGEVVEEEGEVVEEEGEVLEEEHVAVGVSVMDVDEREEGEIFDDEDGEVAGVCAGSDRDRLADEITEECAALNVGGIRGESVNCLLEDVELKQEDGVWRGGKSRHGNEHGWVSHDEAASFRSRAYPEVSPIENEDQREVQSGSYGSRESEVPTKRKREDEVNLKWHKEQRHSESRDSDRNLYHDRKRSATPEAYRENFNTRERSPSYIKYFDEVKGRPTSRPASRLRERPYDLNHRTSHANSSDSWESIRSYSDSERAAVHDKRDRHKIRYEEVDYERDKLRRREREYSVKGQGRHDRFEGRHGSQDRHRESERESSRDRELDRRREREGVRDRSRDKHGDRAMTREINMENERKRNRTKEVVRDRERTRDSNSDRTRSRDSHRDRIREADKHKYRDRVGDHDSRGRSQHSRKEEDEKYQEKIEQQLAKQEEEDPEKIIEESRKRRQAILEKYKQQQLQRHSGTPADNEEKEDNEYVAANNNPTVDAAQLVPPNGSTGAHDMSDASATDIKFTIRKSSCQNGEIPEAGAGAGGPGYGTPKSERSADMFCDDIFGESPAGVRIMGKEAHLAVERTAAHDNWDDAEGYYSYRFGEVLDGRYEIIAAHGKGVFSTVVRVKDLKVGKGEPEEVAIKIIRNNNTMYKAGLDELVVLKKLAGADPEDKRHCVRFISSFKYRNHLCLVFESLHMNLREVLKKFGRNIGLKLTAVRAYAKQLFIALKHLRNCGVLHCDIKPDNMLVNEAKNVLKLCDFGNAMFAGKNEITPYLVSRFYRSPEIILGLPYDHPMDMWSVGCCLFELYNGKVLFPGPSNNEMLRLHMELKGPFPKKMLRKGAFADQHFDHDLNFHATEEDHVTKKPVKRLLLNVKPKDMGTIFTSFPEEDPKMLGHFKDLLERIFVLDPEKRLTVSQALSHPFITGK